MNRLMTMTWALGFLVLAACSKSSSPTDAADAMPIGLDGGVIADASQDDTHDANLPNVTPDASTSADVSLVGATDNVRPEDAVCEFTYVARWQGSTPIGTATCEIPVDVRDPCWEVMLCLCEQGASPDGPLGASSDDPDSGFVYDAEDCAGWWTIPRGADTLVCSYLPADRDAALYPSITERLSNLYGGELTQASAACDEILLIVRD